MLIQCNPAEVINPALDKGRDLTEIFKSEIKGYANEWEWIKNRIKNADFKGIRNADYIPLTIGNETHQMQAAGIDTYYRTTDREVPHHIDFISRDCYSQTVEWNKSNTNNGNAGSPYPYMASNVHSFLDTLYNSLPGKIKAVITNKRTLLEQRYSASGTLTDSTGWGWADAGRLWLPTEYEVFGSVVWGTRGWSAGQAVQYPIFANSWHNRIKGAGPSGARCYWWLACAGGVRPFMHAVPAAMALPTTIPLPVRSACRSASVLLRSSIILNLLTGRPCGVHKNKKLKENKKWKKHKIPVTSLKNTTTAMRTAVTGMGRSLIPLY